LFNSHYAISTPLIWIDTAVVDAPPVIVFVVAKTCFTSMVVTLLAGIDTVGNSETPSSATVTVDDVAAVLATTMLLITVVVALGTV
jgi:hypothetical protein